MKNTQKKLKAKNFRYLNEDIIKNPMIYIDDFFKHETQINYWQNDINLFVNVGAYPSITSCSFTEHGYYCQQMIKQIEVAYVIFKQCRIPKQKNPLQFFAKRKDYYNYANNFEFTRCGKKDGYDLISKFFSFQSISKWYETMDDLMQQLTLQKANKYNIFGDEIVVIRELLIRLAYALYYIYENKSLLIPVPSYVKIEPATIDQNHITTSQGDQSLDDNINQLEQEKTEENKVI